MSIQIGQDVLVLKSDQDGGDISLWKNEGAGNFTEIEMPGLYRGGYAICKSHDRYVYATGGRQVENM